MPERPEDVVVTRLAEVPHSKRYEEFLRRASLSAGLYRLPAGAADGQSPHEEDELYYVVAGEAVLDASGRKTKVTPGSLAFVAKRVPHRFVDITADLELLVFFAPAEGG
jgi:mannose-6-phosphate isomerase-like protein (cupin superfamily)